MKKINIFLTLFIFCISICGCSNNNSKNQGNNSISSENTFDKTNISIEIDDKEYNKQPEEIEISSFSTPLKSKSAGRLNNIQITCSAINEYVVNSGEEFSFCSIVGKSTPEKGYQKADVIIDKEIVQAYGGGNCQVSSTLYNAVLNVSDLTVTERHPHGRKVNYVDKDKDAAISYGSLDFKFKNDTDFKIKIYANADEENVNIRITKIEE